MATERYVWVPGLDDVDGGGSNWEIIERRDMKYHMVMATVDPWDSMAPMSLSKLNEYIKRLRAFATRHGATNVIRLNDREDEDFGTSRFIVVPWDEWERQFREQEEPDCVDYKAR